jgi:tRNA threonylcarbamoyladenosine biosynthesis protein TsaE
MKRHHISLSETKSFAEKLAKSLQGGEVIGLIGPLGSGKTTFTKHLGKALGVTRRITSPTFTIEQVYPTAKKSASKPESQIHLHHLDMYRLPKDADPSLLGMKEFMNRADTITVIEWADRFTKILPPQTILIDFS